MSRKPCEVVPVHKGPQKPWREVGRDVLDMVVSPGFEESKSPQASAKR